MAADLEKARSHHYSTSRRCLDDAENEIDQARRIVAGKIDQMSVTECAAVAPAHAQIAQAAP